MPDELLLSIEKLVYGGDGLSHADGNTVFVPYVMPGEKVRAAVKTEAEQVDLGAIAGGCFSRAATPEGALPSLSNLRRLPLPAHSGGGATAAEEGDFAGNAVATGPHHLGRAD